MIPALRGGESYSAELVSAMRELATAVQNSRTSSSDADFLGQHFGVCVNIRSQLGRWFSLDGLDQVLFRGSFWRLMSVGYGSPPAPTLLRLAGTESHELESRLVTCDDDVEHEMLAWRNCGTLVVPDTNIFLHALEHGVTEANWHELADLRPMDTVTVVILGVVVDELDRNKRKGMNRSAEARRALREINDLLGGERVRSLLQPFNLDRMTGTINIATVFEDLNHVPLGTADREIIARTAALRDQHGTECLLLTGDVGMSFRAEKAGVDTRLLSTPNP